MAIAHDIAKEMTDEEMLEYAKLNHIEVDEIESIQPSLLHGKIGADIAAKKYGFTEDMVNAIKWHTTGRKNMSMLEKIIYVADKTEENNPVAAPEPLNLSNIFFTNPKYVLEIIPCNPGSNWLFI